MPGRVFTSHMQADRAIADALHKLFDDLFGAERVEVHYSTGKECGSGVRAGEAPFRWIAVAYSRLKDPGTDAAATKYVRTVGNALFVAPFVPTEAAVQEWLLDAIRHGFGGVQRRCGCEPDRVHGRMDSLRATT